MFCIHMCVYMMGPSGALIVVCDRVCIPNGPRNCACEELLWDQTERTDGLYRVR